MKIWDSCGRSAIVSLVAVTLVVLLPQVAEAQTTHTVCPPGNLSAPCDYDSPDAALNDAATVVSGDTVEIVNDAYTLTGSLLVDRSLTLNFNGSVVDAAGLRGVEVSGTSTIASINDVTIINGSAPAGETGGAIRVSGGSNLTLTGSTLQNNFAETGGGGLSNANSIVTVLNTVFSRNTTEGDGGAVLTTGSTANTSLSEVTVDGNVAGTVGGGISANSEGNIEITDSLISRNVAGLVPAAIADPGLDPGELISNFGNPINNPSLPNISPSSCTSASGSFVGQTFVAVNGNALTGYRFLNSVGNTGTIGADIFISGRVRSGGPAGPVIAETSAVIPAGTPNNAVIPLEFTPNQPVALIAGNTYAVEMTFPGGNRTFIYNSGNAYADGAGYRCSETTGTFDLEFEILGGSGTTGGIHVDGTVNMSNSTVTENVGNGVVAASRAAGPGFSSFQSVSSTFFGNSGIGVWGEVGPVSGLVSILGNIIAGSGAEDCLGETFSVDSGGSNLIGDGTGCNTPQNPDDLWGTAVSPLDPLLGPLQDNGGPTFTRAPAESSPAVDSASSCFTGFDQRGVTRPQGPACDIGAFELQPAVGALQGLIDAAAPGATIVLPAGTYNEGITIGDGKILQGAGPGSTIIDATGLNVPGVVATGDFTMSGMRVTGADIVGQGGGIDIAVPAVVALDDVRVDSNRASGAGGGIFVASGSDLSVTNSTVDLNTSGSEGGGIYVSASASITIDNTTVANNTAGDHGGGIYAGVSSNVMISVSACALTPPANQGTTFISNNTAGDFGGGLWTAGTATIAYSQFSGNSAAFGGGIHQESGTASMDLGCSTLNLNQADANFGRGGAGNFADGTVTVRLVTFESNQAGAGGGALNLESGADIANSTFLTNVVPFGNGGAIRSILGTLNSSDNTFLSNQGGASGGAVFASTMVSNSDVFQDNAASNGGGAITFAASGQMQMFDGVLQENFAGDSGGNVGGRGGALEVLGAGGLIQNTRFVGNAAPDFGDGGSQGGAIYNAATLELIVGDSTISSSSANNGGAVFNTGILSIARSTLANNSVTENDGPLGPQGGAVASQGGIVNLSNSTLTGNVVNASSLNGAGRGGAIAITSGAVGNLNNVTLAFNSAPDGGALYAEPNLGELSFTNTLFANNGGTTADCDRVQSQGFNIYDVNPCPTQAETDLIGDPLIGLLTDNGGPTETHALLPGSPAQDAGGPALFFPGFTSLDAFSLQGDAALDGSSLLLAGAETVFTVSSAYIANPVDVTAGFSAQFDFQITPGSGGGTSDGITFTIGDDPTFLGDNGGALGIGSFNSTIGGGLPYVPSGPTVSGVSIEFDTWDNGSGVGANDPGQEHVGINLDGSLSSAALAVIGPAGTLSSGSPWTAWVDYDATTNLLEVRVSDTGSRPALPTVSLTVDIQAETDANGDGNVYVGFTGAAANLDFIGGEHRILSFEFINDASCERVDQRSFTRPEGLRCDIGAFEGAAIPGTIDNAVLDVTTNVTQPGVVEVPLIDIPIEKLTGEIGDATNPPESAPLSSFPLSSFPLSSLDLRASPLSSFPLSSFPLSSFEITGAPLSSFPLSSFPLVTEPGGWAAIIAQIPSLAGAPLQNVTLEQVLKAPDLPAGLLDGITLGSFSIQGSPLSSLSLAALALGDDITVDTLNQWLASAGSTSTVCGELAADGFPVTDCETTDTLVSLQVKGAPLSSLPLSSLPLSSFPLSSFPLSSFPLSSLPLSSFPLSSFPLSSFPLSSLPLSSFPLSSLPLSSFPLSSLDVLYAPLSSFPLSSFPLSSLPLSSFNVGGRSFCAYYDARAAADAQPTCSDLGIDPGSDGLQELVAALHSAGTVNLASTPLSSFPLSSFDIASVPLSSFQLDFATVAGAPLSSFPLSSLPLSSLPLSSFGGGSEDFCTAYDAAAIAEGQATCGILGITSGSDFGDLIAALLTKGQSTFASTPLSSFPLSSLPLSSLPLSSFPLSSLEINGTPLSSFPLSSFDVLGSPLSSLPLSSLPLSSLGIDLATCEGCTTLGDAVVAGQDIAGAPLSSLFASSEFGAIELGDLLDAFTLEYLFGIGAQDPTQSPNLLGDVADPGSLTLGQLLISLILRSDFPWENIALSDLDPQAFAADNWVDYFLDFELNGTLVAPVTMDVTLSEQFHLVPGSVRFATGSQGGGTSVLTPIADPVMTPNPDGTVTMTFGPVFPGAFSNNTLQFITVPPLALGNFPTSASLNLGNALAATADASTAAVEVVPSANNESDSIDFPASTVTNTLILGHINSREDIDYFRISAPPKGSRVAVFLANPVEDNDLLLYEPLSTVEAKGQTVEAASLDSIPFEDDGVDFGGNRTEEPDALDDTNIGVLPLSSLSTNRGDENELVSAISDGEDFTLQVSGYNGSVSDQPYALRIKVTAEVPITQCSARSWVTGATGTGDWTPAGSWQPDTNAVFLVNWQRLADSEQALGRDGPAAADAALNAVNALVNAPGVTNGVVVDVSTIPGVNYAPWDLDPCDVDAANNVVNAITAYLEQQRAVSPNLAYVTIVGSDEVIPFKRKGDETDIANESTFATSFADNALYGSMASRNFLSDDTYGDIDPVRWSSGRFLNVPELAVGRLVESAADIQTAAENYLIAGGVLTPTTALSAGYDFVADASTDIQESFSAYGLDSTALIDQPGAELPWDRDRFLQEAGLLNNTARDVVSFNMHFDYDDALPSSGDALRLDGSSDYQSNLINVSDLAGNDLTGRIWFTVGCHSGINAADIAMLNGEPTQDWAQTLNSLGAVYVGQAAYGLGDTVALALTERLLANFARNLNGNVTAGQAHAFAKQGYFKDLGVYGEYDYKALQASVYFGLPMYRVQNPLIVEEPLPLLRPVVRDPISNLESFSLTIEPNVTRIDDTEKGTVYSVDGDTQFVHYRPLQPIIGVDVTSEDPELVARSAFITGLVTRDELVADMAFARPVIDEGALEPEIETDSVVFPTRFANVSSYRVPADPGPFQDRQQLNIIAGQYTSDAGQDFGTQRIFTSVDVQVFYQPVTGAAPAQVNVARASSVGEDTVKSGVVQTGSGVDDTRPELDNINASVVQSGTDFQAAFTVDASDTVGVVTRVAVLYRKSFDGQNSTWVLEDLVNSGGTTWTGGASVDSSGLINGEVDYLVQALDDSGNVANSTFKGTFYVARQTPLPPPPDGGGNGAFGIELKDINGDNVTPGDWSRVDPVVVSVTNRAPGVAYEFALDSPNFVPLGGDITVSGDGVHFVTVREVGGSNSASFTVLIDDTPPTVLVSSPFNGQFVVTSDDAPTAAYKCLDSGSGPAICDGTVAVGQPVSMAPGTQTFSVGSTDFAGNLASGVTNTYYVVDPLIIDSPLDPVSIQDPVVVSGSATDLVGFAETVTVAWGDGVSETFPLSEFLAGVSHVYAAPNIYRVTATLSYAGAFSQQAVSDFVVVYDPAGGFVTGGGWIDSPPGAYTPNDDTDPDVTGKASFGFVAKYKRGQSIPDGNTNFKFKAGDLSFKSVDYEYLIITGARARFKGRGTVNGGSELYMFKLTALDSDVNNSDSHDLDSFRIQIWDDNGVLYDNGRGADDATGDGGTTALGGGSISIKDK